MAKNAKFPAGARILNIALLVCFLITILVPLTGVRIHKLASTLFLLLSIVHTLCYRRRLGAKKFLLLGMIVICFASGLIGMILDQYPIILTLHKAVSIAAVFFLAIHIFVYHKRLITTANPKQPPSLSEIIRN